MRMNAEDLLPLLHMHGRTYYDSKRNTIFFNWTCSGFTVHFRGSTLRARLAARTDPLPAFPGMPASGRIAPYFGVVPDGAEDPVECRLLRQPDEWVTLFEGDFSEHSLRLVKLSENSRGKLGLLEMETDGTILPAPDIRVPHIEIVGDSISCGLGNRTTDGAILPRPDEEDGWMSYGAVAARELGTEWSVIAESGIEVSRPEKAFFDRHGMDELYAFTDEPCFQSFGDAPELWDFAAHPSDAIVINLGTNDGNTVRYYHQLGLSFADVPAMEEHFRMRYSSFLRTVRALNGPKPLIACTLGPMDYYLWDRLYAAVEDYRRECGDERIIAFKFVGINGRIEGVGAGGHPSLKTHIRMGHELAEVLRPWL